MSKKRRPRFGDPRKRKPLVGDLAKLVQPSGAADPRKLGGTMAGPGGSRERDAVVIDTTDCVLMERVDVAVVETVRAGSSTGRAAFMTLGGRVNKTDRQVDVGFAFDTDGAAAIITELLALADRDGTQFLTDLTSRLAKLSAGGHVDLDFLRAALDLAIAAEAG